MPMVKTVEVPGGIESVTIKKIENGFVISAYGCSGTGVNMKCKTKEYSAKTMDEVMNVLEEIKFSSK